MARYSSSNLLGGTQQAVAAAYKTLLSLTAATATLCGASVYDIIVGTDGTPADNAMVFDVSKQTAAGTITAVTPVLLSNQHRAAGTVAAANATAEGTITANSSVLTMPLNQRATYRWVASSPDYGLIIPATNLAGFAIRVKSAGYTGTADATAFHEE